MISSIIHGFAAKAIYLHQVENCSSIAAAVEIHSFCFNCFKKKTFVCTVFLFIVVIFLKKKHPNSIENSVPLQWGCIVFVQELFV